MKKEKLIGFKIAKIDCIDFGILSSNPEKNVPINIDLNSMHQVDKGNKAIGIFEFSFKEEEKPFLKISVRCIFQIDDEGWATMVGKKKDKMTLPKNLMAHLYMLTIGTTRGILCAKTEHSPYNVHILPTVNASELVPTDIECSFLETAQKELAS
jgi:hypothetical protein